MAGLEQNLDSHSGVPDAMTDSAGNVLLLIHYSSLHIGTVADHVQAFKSHSKHRFVCLDSVAADRMDLDFERFDSIVLHYSLVISSETYISPSLAGKLAGYRGVKCLYIQDEMRWVDRTAEAIRRLGVGIVFTVVNQEVIRKIYRHEWLKDVRFEVTLTGFVPRELLNRSVPPYESRAIDVAYRARRLPAWCGGFAQQKWAIGERFEQDAKRYGLNCDISSNESDRLYGKNWIAFLENSKAVLGTESGASFVDYTGEVGERIDDFSVRHPDATFEEIADRFLEGRDGEFTIHVVSPRCFEAAALRTLMIMYPGDYSGALVAGRHYVELAPDHSNMDEVVATIRDPERAGEIIENAYREVACNERWSYASAAGHFDYVLSEELPARSAREIRIESPVLLTREEIAALETRGARLALWRARKYRAAVLLNQMAPRLQNTVVEHLPRMLSEPALVVLRRLSRILKPTLKRFLLS